MGGSQQLSTFGLIVGGRRKTVQIAQYFGMKMNLGIICKKQCLLLFRTEHTGKQGNKLPCAG